ncbi:MAG: hypothetical protein GY710_18730 [Desulfobacteraceae bacterium]|nr:hypothetical protein [Desulfobacteraceae bacterium]
MTKRKSPLKKVKHTVLTFDICSSSDILEDLLRSENIKRWRDLLIWMQGYLNKRSGDCDYEMYKFTGDGWILLFKYDCVGEDLFDFIRKFSIIFSKKISKLTDDFLETTPAILGLTFGIDRGTLARFIMEQQVEYIGRPINVACRLQGSIKDKDKKPQYKVLMTKSVFKNIKNDIKRYNYKNVTRKLRNIAGDKIYNCVKATIM